MTKYYLYEEYNFIHKLQSLAIFYLICKYKKIYVIEVFMEIYAVKVLDISENVFDKLCLLIDEDKKYKIHRFVNKQDKIRSLIADILVRFIIMKKLLIKNETISFKRNDYGKPFLKGYQNFNFNISHSEDFVVCAIDEKPIGIDIEKINQIEYEEIWESFFSISEKDYIKRTIDNRLNRFYEIWTLKESYIKLYGKGLSIPLRSFSIAIDENENISVIMENERKEYYFKMFDLDDEYKIAVCSSKKEISNDITLINQESLINNYLKNLSD